MDSMPAVPKITKGKKKKKLNRIIINWERYSNATDDLPYRC